MAAVPRPLSYCADFWYGRDMNPNEKLDLQRDAIHGLAEQFNAANPRVVGQTTQNGSGTGTLDLLVDALPGTTLFDLGGLQIALETLLGVRVDLLTTGDLPSDIRELVLAVARPL